MGSATVRLRLSAIQISLILPALRFIVAADHLWQSEGRLVRASRDVSFYECRIDTSRYKPIGMKTFLAALTKLSALVGGGRVRLDHLEIAACMVAPRHTGTMIRHGHLRPWLKDHQTPTETLRAKLERYRRRARRRTVKQLGEDVYRDARDIWADVLCWIHTFYIWCDCTRPKGSRYLRW